MQAKVKVVEPVVKIVKEQYGKLPMAIGTGGRRKTVERTLEVIDFFKYFDHIITADDVKNHKPDPETFVKCSDLMKVAPANILVFEDGDLGIEAAIKAGMNPVDVRSWYDYNW